MQTGAVIAIQDMGAAGLTCSAVEMGAKGDLGIELDLDKVPVREERMTAYEMMLSESQERMLMVLQPEKEAIAKAIFVKWGLDFAIVGKTTDDLRFRVIHQGEEVANLPIKDLGDRAPEYDRPWRESDKRAALPADLVAAPEDYGQALLKLVGSANQSSRRWVYEQYDTLIQGNSLQLPGGDAGVVRVEGHPTKALAFSSDVTPRYVEADPFEGGKQAVAECWRNITATGAEPLAATDNLNFGNPEKPEIMGQFVGAIKGIGEACRALDFPIVSGNVSLYNETNGVAILPTPTIAGVGLLPDWKAMARIGSASEGDHVLMIGVDGSHLGSSIYLRDIIGSTDGPARKSISSPNAVTAISCARPSATVRSRPATTSRPAASRSLWRKWRWHPARACGSISANARHYRMQPCSARIKPAMSSPFRPMSPISSASTRKAPAYPSAALVRLAVTHSSSTGC